MDLSFNTYLMFIARVAYLGAAFFMVIGVTMVLQGLFGIKLDGSMEEPREKWIWYIKSGAIAIILASLALFYLSGFMTTSTVDYI